MDGPIPHIDTTTFGANASAGPKLPRRRKRARMSSEENARILVTRRNLILGAAGIAAVAAGGVAFANRPSNEAQTEDIPTLTVAEDAVFDLESCAEVDPADAFELIGNYDLPFGTLVWANDPYVAACLFPTEEPSPLANLGILQLTSGAYFTMREAAVGAEEGFEIYDARATSSGLVWMEAAVMEGLWRLYTATLGSDLTLGEPQLVDEGDATVEAPTLAASGDYAFWQTMAPITNEDARHEPSTLKRASFSDGKATTLFEGTGRMNAPLVAYENSIVFTPRHPDATSYCDLVCIDAETGQVLDSITLPSGMFPNQVGYGPTGFAFCFESIYDYGGGIANLGTYTPAHEPEQGGYNDCTWFRFNRTPSTAPCWCTQTWFMVKSNQSVCAVNFPNKVFCSFGVESGCLDWGDFLVSSGMCDTVVTAMQIDQVDNEGQETKKTQVRVWQPLSAVPESTEANSSSSTDTGDDQDNQEENN